VKVTNFDDEAAEVSRVEYRYDANDKLIGRKEFYGGSGTASASGVFVYQNGQIVLQFDGTGNDDLTYQNLGHRYLWGPTVDFLLADEQIDWTDTYADGPVYWALGDHLGTPRDWVDNAGEVVDHAVYDYYGTRLNGAGIGAAFDWTARWRDPLTGLQYNDARWYNPGIGRWMSEDPIGFAARDANLSRYVGNEATKFVDPSGLVLRDPRLDSVDEDLRNRIGRGQINDDEANLRHHIIRNALGSNISFENPKPWRNPEYWLDGPDGYFVSPWQKPSDAINDIWNNPERTRTGCKKATSLIILKGMLDLAANKDKKNRTTEAVDAFNDLIVSLGNKPPTDIHDRPDLIEVIENDRGFSDDDLIPGDQVWFRNPRYKRGHGTQGTNVFYLGGGKFISYNGDVVDAKTIKKLINSWDGAPTESIKIERIRRPKVPGFCR